MKKEKKTDDGTHNVTVTLRCGRDILKKGMTMKKKKIPANITSGEKFDKNHLENLE